MKAEEYILNNSFVYVCFYDFDFNLEYFDLDSSKVFPKNEE